MNEWLPTIKEVGFPAALAGYLIWNELKAKRRLEQRIIKLEGVQQTSLVETVGKNTKAMEELKLALNRRPCLKGGINE